MPGGLGAAGEPRELGTGHEEVPGSGVAVNGWQGQQLERPQGQGQQQQEGGEGDPWVRFGASDDPRDQVDLGRAVDDERVVIRG